MYFRLIIGGKTLDEVQQAAQQAAERLGGARVEISNNLPSAVSAKLATFEAADKQLQEEAAINEMYNPTVDNSVESVNCGTAEVFHQAVTEVLSGERDSKGMPWDERIHSSSKATNKDGSWRYRRNLDEVTIAQVEAQLRGGATGGPSATPVQQPASASVGQPMVPAFPTQPTVTVPPPHSPQSVPVPQFDVPVFPQAVSPVAVPQATPVQSIGFATPAVAPIATTPTASQPLSPTTTAYDPIQIPQGIKPAHSFETFKANFLPCMGELSMSQKITPDYIQKLCASFQVNNLWEVEADESKVRSIYDLFTQHGLITRV